MTQEQMIGRLEFAQGGQSGFKESWDVINEVLAALRAAPPAPAPELVALVNEFREAWCDYENAGMETVDEALASMRRARIDLFAWTPAAPVGEPAAMPPEMPEVKHGDLIVWQNGDIQQASKQLASDINHEPKAWRIVGLYRDPLWRRTDRKEPTS